MFCQQGRLSGQMGRTMYANAKGCYSIYSSLRKGMAEGNIARGHNPQYFVCDKGYSISPSYPPGSEQVDDSDPSCVPLTRALIDLMI
jgi:hypothetical protein